MLSIVILTCNQSTFTLRCLDSLGEYMLRHASDEVILVDNGSTDGTGRLVTERAYEWSDRLRYFYLDRNRGVASGRNYGVKKSSGDVIMFLDNDTIVNTSAIERLYDIVTSDSRSGIVAPQLLSPGGVLQANAKGYPGIAVKIRNLMGLGRDNLADRDCDRPVSHPDYVIGACQMLRRKVFDEVGGLDENIFYGPEDADFCIRVNKAGYDITCIHDIKLIHDWQRATRKSIFSPLAFKHMRGLVYLYVKHRRLF